MIPHKMDTTDAELALRAAQKKKTYNQSRFKFLSSHRGIRPNKFHLVIAPTHIGKSTLMTAVGVDFVLQNPGKKCLVVKTEESREDFESELSCFIQEHEGIKENLHCLIEDKDLSLGDLKKAYIECIEYYRYDLVIFDNITTSKLYQDRPVGEQGDTANWLKSLLKYTTIFVVAHTNAKDSGSRMLDETDIRGSKTITNLVEFLYVLQPVWVGSRLLQFISIRKNRGQKTENKFFRLHYDHTLMTFTHDTPVEFKDIKQAFKQRNTI